MDLTEAEDIKKRWQEYTEELYKKNLHDQDNHDDVITHLEPDILESEVKWALGTVTMNKASGGDGIPAAISTMSTWSAMRYRFWFFSTISFPIIISFAYRMTTYCSIFTIFTRRICIIYLTH